MPRASILVLTQMPDQASAETLARSLVEARLAACVSIGASLSSLYHWRGKIETATETPVVVKTCQDAYAAIEAEIRRLHPYELPEIVAIPVVAGLPGYLDWIERETRRDGTHPA